MRKQTLIGVALICLGVVLSMGCTRPLYNVHDAPIISPAGRTLSLDEVTEAILKSTTYTAPKWELRKMKPGLIRGVINFKQHQGIVDIPYTTQTFSIIYKDSSRLRYEPARLDEEGNQAPQMIHRHYNSWVRNLEQAIKTNLQLVPAVGP